MRAQQTLRHCLDFRIEQSIQIDNLKDIPRLHVFKCFTGDSSNCNIKFLVTIHSDNKPIRLTTELLIDNHNSLFGLVRLQLDNFEVFQNNIRIDYRSSIKQMYRIETFNFQRRLTLWQHLYLYFCYVSALRIPQAVTWLTVNRLLQVQRSQDG